MSLEAGSWSWYRLTRWRQWPGGKDCTRNDSLHHDPVLFEIESYWDVPFKVWSWPLDTRVQDVQFDHLLTLQLSIVFINAHSRNECHSKLTRNSSASIDSTPSTMSCHWHTSCGRWSQCSSHQWIAWWWQGLVKISYCVNQHRLITSDFISKVRRLWCPEKVKLYQNSLITELQLRLCLHCMLQRNGGQRSLQRSPVSVLLLPC